MKVLLTGGAGYIGSHTAIELIAAGHEVVIVDNLDNSKASVMERIEEISKTTVAFHELDVSDQSALEQVIADESVEGVIHFAGLKAVGESVADPLLYYSTNLTTSLSLCGAMLQTGLRHLVFSSSCTVYGEPREVPLLESSEVSSGASPYGNTKIFIEQILRDLSAAHPDFNIALLRYFNPAGAHPSGRLGEDPLGVPNNLVPFITQVAVGKREELTVNGSDYDTPDGTCIRDYIHVQDLARGHVAALEKLNTACGCVTYNLGTGKGTSVLQVISAFERATNQHVPRRIGPRREGDVPSTWCDPGLANRELNWKAEKTIEDICADAWRWQDQNPDGYP